MKLSELIQSAQNHLAMHGDMDVLMKDCDVTGLSLQVASPGESEYWDKPVGYTFFRIESME